MNEPIVVNYRLQGHIEEIDYHAHSDFYEIYFFHAGTCKYLVEKQIYHLQPGDILLLDGTLLHKPYVLPNSEYIRSHIHFSPKWISGLLGELNANYLLESFITMRHYLIRTEENEESIQLETLISWLEKVWRSNKGKKQESIVEAKLLLIEILLSLYRLRKYGARTQTIQKTNKEMYVDDIVSYIQRNYSKKLTLDTIAKDLNLSKSYVSHIFKEVIGLTVMEYLQNYRLTQAKLMLELDPDQTLQEIALATGFESVSHFSRFFSQTCRNNRWELSKDTQGNGSIEMR